MPEIKLPPREMQAVRLARLGYTNHEIAIMQGVTYGTARKRMGIIYKKIGTKTKNPRVEVAVLFAQGKLKSDER